jgi:hypothetical protein
VIKIDGVLTRRCWANRRISATLISKTPPFSGGFLWRNQTEGRRRSCSCLYRRLLNVADPYSVLTHPLWCGIIQTCIWMYFLV